MFTPSPKVQVKQVLPNVPRTRNKIRDAKICRLYSTEGLTMEELGKRFNLSKMRISIILKYNAHLLNWDRQYEKAKRLNRLQREIDVLPVGHLSRKKDALDVLEAQRKELEDKPQTNINIVNQNSVTINNFSSLIEKFHADRLQA